MLKHSLAILIVGSLVSGSSFATPSIVKKVLARQSKTSIVTKKQSQHSYPFDGVWAGVCEYDGNAKEESKIRIEQGDHQITITDLMDDSVEEYFFNTVSTQTDSSKYMYSTFVHKMLKPNDNTLKLEGAGLVSDQLSPNHGEKSMTYSVTITSTFAVTQDQLKIDASAKSTYIDLKYSCNYKRAG